MKVSKFIRQCGPYEVHSSSQDGLGVRLQVFPAFTRYNLSAKDQQDKHTDPSWQKEPRWALHRYKGEGGGPSMFAVVALAAEFEKFLNQSYSEAEVEEWKATLDASLKKIREAAEKRFEKAMAKAEKRGAG